MDDYNRYVTAVNKIYDYLEKMKAGWNNQDNKNYIENIDSFKSIVTAKANEFKKPRTVSIEQAVEDMETQEKEEAAKEAAMQERRQAPPPPPSEAPAPAGSAGSMVTVGTAKIDVPNLPASFVPSNVPIKIPGGEGLTEW